MTSEYVRQELRTKVAARTQQQSNGNSQQRQLQLGPNQSVSTADLEALGLICEMPPGKTTYLSLLKQWS